MKHIVHLFIWLFFPDKGQLAGIIKVFLAFVTFMVLMSIVSK